MIPDAAIADEVDPRYWNLVSPFGGWTASRLLRAVLDDAAHLGEPLAMTTNFLAPIENRTFTIAVRQLRRNRTTDFWWAELRQETAAGDDVRATLSAVLAVRRPVHDIVEQRPPDAPAPENVPRVKTPARLPFFEQYDVRHATGAPFTNSGSSHSISWVRHSDPQPLDAPALAAICDIGTPRIFYHLPAPVPTATVTMNVFFHAGAAELAAVGTDFVLLDARGRIVKNSFYDMQTHVWSRGGALLATTEQLLWYKVPSDPSTSSG